MFDLHNHLLPGIDDGAKDWDMAMNMARMAYADGIRGMAFTPHNSAWWNNYFPEKVERLTQEFQTRLKEASIGLEVGPGAEIYIDSDILKRLKDGRAAPLNQSRYLLVELPFNNWPMATEQIFFELQAAGYLPIMAHPERNSAVMQKPDLMCRMAERGILGQITSGSLEGKFGRIPQKLGLYLLAKNWSHFIASDAHDLKERTPTLAGAYKIAEAFFGGKRAHAMVSTLPEKIFRNQDVVVDPPIEDDLEPPRPRNWLNRLLGR